MRNSGSRSYTSQALTDALSVAAHSSGVILVVETGRTKAPQARAVIDSLHKVGATVLGVVLNKAKDRQLGSYYYYEQTSQGGASANGSGPPRALPPNRAEDAIAQPPPPAAQQR